MRRRPLRDGIDENNKEQQSDVADLALAVGHFKLAETKCPLLVITADTIFYQDYNFGRVLEHSFVRNKDTVGTYELTPGRGSSPRGAHRGSPHSPPHGPIAAAAAAAAPTRVFSQRRLSVVCTGYSMF